MRQRLKSLELQGYKTFASKTRFEFPDQITAIVGPNGSGKSNIADAIRWVLGEQAYSLLRGKKTIDMIFTGSEHRSRASMASASILFNNEDGWLPIDYAEVSLTRRAYRSGENEYLLNNTRVRLKEINELLANSGLSERTYTIIGQGLVDAALSLKPEERRRFFEEAAGIELYRSRRDEAIQKLDNTLRNMDRVRDILSELGPRLKSLEKQSERAREYDRLKADLFILLRDWYGFQWNKLQEDFTFAKDFYEKQEGVLTAARQNQSETVIKLEEIQAQITTKRTELSNWRKETSQLHLAAEEMNKELAVLGERERSIQDKALDLNREIVLQEERLASRTKQLEDWQKEREKKAEDLRVVLEQHADLNQRIEERQTERQRIDDEIRKIRESVQAWEIRQFQIRARKEELDQRIGLYEKNITDLKSSMQNDEENRKTIEKEQAQLNDAIKKIKEALAQNDQTIGEMEEKIQFRFASIKKTREEISRHEASRLSKQAQLDILENAEQTLSGFTSGSKSIFTAAKSGRLSGKFVLLLSQIKTDAQYETAIASVLGDLLETLILDEGKEPDEVLKFIENNESARTALLVQSWAKDAAGKMDAFTGAGVISAADVVKINEPYRKVITALLGNVFIVKDRTIAKRLALQSTGDIRLVTLQGEVFYPNGLVIAGKETRVKTISRTREKDELSSSLKELFTAINLSQKRLDDEEKQLAELEENLKKEKEIRAANQKTSDELTNSANSQTGKINQINLRLDWLSGQIADLTNKIKQGQEEQAGITSEEDELKAKIKEQSERNIQLYAQLKEIPLEALQEELYFANAQKTVEEQAARNLDERIKEIEQEIHTLNAQKEESTNRVNDNEKTLQEVRNSRREFSLKADDVAGKLEQLRQKISPVEIELVDLENGFQKLQRELDQSRQQFAVIERHSIQAQMKLNRVRDQQDNLSRRIEEDFGLVLYEYGHTVEGPTPLPIEGMVENLPKLDQIPDSLEEDIRQQRTQLRRMGPINPEAQKEYQEVHERHVFITGQLHDLDKAEADLRLVVKELDELMKTEFQKTFNKVNDEFREIFKKLFGGGSAELVIEDEENLTESGIDIQAMLPGKRKQELALLSGGERSLTAVALIFALLKVSPTPFCILDEVDAMLDESNVMRFGELLRELSESTQFIVITHNRNTVQLANVLYGVTMGKDSTSQVISLKLDELTEEMVQ